MNRLAEILRTGRAPGFNLKTVDPQLPERAVPKAFKDLEQTMSADRIALAAGHSVKKIKRVWAMAALLTGLLALPAGAFAGDLTRSITFTDGNRLTAAQLHTLVDGATIKTSFLTGKDLLSAVDGTDYVLIYDTSAAVFKRMRLSSLVTANTNLITDQVASGSLAPTDFFLIYDVTRGALGKVSYTNLISGNTNLIGQQPAITNLTEGAVFLVLDSGTNRQINLPDLWQNFQWRAALTNLSEHTAPTNTDRLLIWDSSAGTNKWTGLSGLVTNLPTVTTNSADDWLLIVTNGNVAKISANSFSNTLAAQLIANTLPRRSTSSLLGLTNVSAAGTYLNVAHGLSAAPQNVELVLVCTTASLNYAIGDEVRTPFPDPHNITVYGNTTNVGFTCTGSAGNWRVPDKSSGVFGAITPASWSAKIYAIYTP